MELLRQPSIQGCKRQLAAHEINIATDLNQETSYVEIHQIRMVYMIKL